MAELEPEERIRQKIKVVLYAGVVAVCVVLAVAGAVNQA